MEPDRPLCSRNATVRMCSFETSALVSDAPWVASEKTRAVKGSLGHSLRSERASLEGAFLSFIR